MHKKRTKTHNLYCKIINIQKYIFTTTKTGSLDVFKLSRITILENFKIVLEANVKKAKVLDD